MVQKLKANIDKIWYSLCFLFLGIIDQRRGSSVGEIQMLFSNLTGVVMAMLLLPSLTLTNFKTKIYYIWTPICIGISVLLSVHWNKFCQYQGKWNMGVLNFTVWSYLLIYIFRERKSLFPELNKKHTVFLFLPLLCMVLSVHEKSLTLWYLLIFGGFFIIGIPEKKKNAFYLGMMDGIIIWFVLQQMLAFAFRPYDYVRYHGLYAGETQNAIFYVMAFCAFISKWIWKQNENKKNWVYFFMTAISIAFIFFTGSRSGLLTALVVEIIVITKFDIINNKSFHRWILHGIAMLGCVVSMLPLVYGCIRYIPTVLHHPIWFEGEYAEGESVCSFDPWNSEKYITFNEAINETMGRIVRVLESNIEIISERVNDEFGTIKVYAKELNEEKGSSEGNYYLPDDINPDTDPLWSRKVIYKYYFEHLNLCGHRTTEQGFYTIWRIYYGHAHDMFLQIAYDYGIVGGILFLGMYLYNIVRALIGYSPKKVVNAIFLLGILGFGLWEMVLTPGQITIPLMWINMYLVFTSKHNSNVAVEI